MWSEGKGLEQRTTEKDKKRKPLGVETQGNLNLYPKVPTTLHCQTEHVMQVISMEGSRIFPGEFQTNQKASYTIIFSIFSSIWLATCPTFPISFPVISAGKSTQKYSSLQPTTDSSYLLRCVLSSNFNCPQIIFSHIICNGCFKTLSLISSTQTWLDLCPNQQVILQPISLAFIRSP